MIPKNLLYSGVILIIFAFNMPSVSAGLYEDIYKFTEYEYFPTAYTEVEVENHLNMLSPDEEDIPRISSSIAWLRATMRRFQIAASTEEASTIMYGNPGTLLLRMQSLTNIWSSDANNLPRPLGSSSLEFRTYKDKEEIPFEELQTELESLIEREGEGEEETINYELLNAAVWMYRNGFIVFDNEDNECDTSKSGKGDGTELQFLATRFCYLENLLREISHKIEAELEESPNELNPNTIAIFPVHSFGELGVDVWVRSDDVGLSWKRHINPILPSLDCSIYRSWNQDNPECFMDIIPDPVFGNILGGTYPPPPTEPGPTEGYCSHPIAARGYLCRPQEKTLCPEENIPNTGVMGGEIFLSECKSPLIETPNRITESSMNICGEDGWLLPVNSSWDDTPKEDNNLEATEHENCYVDMVCRPCPPGTGLKEEDGRIELCIDSNLEPLTKYIAIRELVHARQQCDTAYNDKWEKTYETINGCCAMEIQASTVSCNALEEDGVLLGTNIPVQSCAISFSNLRCQALIGSGGLPADAPAGAGICGDNGLDMRPQDVIGKLSDYVFENSEDLQIPLTCEDTILNPDKRMKMLKESLSQVCSPEYNAEYKNTIGNALCHLGQCTEQSLEEHKLIPGRIPWTVQDESFQLESYRKEREQENNHTIAVSTKSFIPPYQPLAKLRKMEDALCQAKGMPRTSIPAFCSLDTTRRTSLPSKTYGLFSEDASNQVNKAKGEHARLISLLPAIGARNASDLLMEYFEPTTISIKSILQSINSALEKLELTQFPLEMCKRVNE